MNIAFTTIGRDATYTVGYQLGKLLGAGDVVSLSGQLGGGKTAFVAGAVRGLGSDDPVMSPTYAIVQVYEVNNFGANAPRRTPTAIVHADVYRIHTIGELYDIGFDEYLDGESTVFIEWGDRITSMLPSNYVSVDCRVDPSDAERRVLHLVGVGGFDQRVLSGLRDAVMALRRGDICEASA